MGYGYFPMNADFQPELCRDLDFSLGILPLFQLTKAFGR